MVFIVAGIVIEVAGTVMMLMRMKKLVRDIGMTWRGLKVSDCGHHCGGDGER